MFRGVNLKDSSIDNVKFILMKNINEPYGEIPKDYIKNVNFKFQDCDTMTIDIPNKIFIAGKQLDEDLFDKILGKHQQIIMELNSTQERFIVTQCNRDESYYKGENGELIPYKVKHIECKSYEYTLVDKNMIATEDLYRQLYYDKTITSGAIDISDGYLNFLEQDTSWRVGHVSELAKKEFGKAYNEFYVNINDVTILNMKKGTTIWERDFNIKPIGQNVVNLKGLYTSIKTYDSNNKLLINDKVVHDTNLNKIYTGVKHVKAIYDGNTDYRYAIHYVITLTDGEVIDRWEDLNLFLDNQKVVFTGIILSYEDGSESETSTIKHRTTEEGEYAYLDFLYQNVCKSFDIILLFDTMNMTISAYDKSEVGENKGIEFSYNFIKTINKKEQLDNVYNKVIVKSSQTSIVDENPFGTDYILDYTYHYNAGLMSEELMSSWDRYLSHIDGKQADLYELRLSKNTYNRKQIKDEAEVTQLNLAVRDLQIRRVDYMKKNTNNQFATEIKNISTQINTKQEKLSTLMTEIQSCKNNIATIDVQIKNILTSISLDGAYDTKGKIFTKELLEELDSITINYVLDDGENYYTVALGLYNYAKKKIEEANKLGVEFDIQVSGVLQNIIIPNGLDWNYYINVGDFVTLVDNDILSDDERGLRIIEFDYNPSEFNISKMTFSNKDKNDDEWKGASNIGHAVSRSNNFINNYKPTIENSVSVNDYINSMLYGDGMDLKATAIRSRSGRVKFDQTEAGLYIIDAFDEDHQIFIGASMICFTSDRWLTVKTCLDEEGLCGRTVVGELILGKQLYICNSNSDGSISNEFYIGNIDGLTHEPNKNGGNFGLRITENFMERIMLGVEQDSDGVRRAKLRLRGKDGEYTLTEEGCVLKDQVVFEDNVSSGYPMRIPYRIDEGVNKVKKAILTLYLSKYRAYERSAKSSGQMTSNSTTTTTTTSGSSSKSSATSAGGGGFSIAKTTESRTLDLYGCMTENAESMGIGQSLIDAINTNNAVQVNTLVGNHKHMLSRWQFSHNHDVQIQQNDHYHNVDLQHNHTITIEGHHHTIEGHTHELDFGVYEQNSMPTNIEVYVNGILVKNGINTDYEVDITKYLMKSTVNDIKIFSQTNGRISANIWASMFNFW